jgi:hypothetical protein
VLCCAVLCCAVLCCAAAIVCIVAMYRRSTGGRTDTMGVRADAVSPISNRGGVSVSAGNGADSDSATSLPPPPSRGGGGPGRAASPALASTPVITKPTIVSRRVLCCIVACVW